MLESDERGSRAGRGKIMKPTLDIPREFSLSLWTMESHKIPFLFSLAF